MILKSAEAVRQYREVAQLSTQILWQLHQKTQAGITPLELDALAEKLCTQNGAKPNFKGVGSRHNPYKHSTCISVNDTVLHGIPTNIPLQKGDLVKLDFGLEKYGINTDQCVTVVVGDFTSDADKKLLETGKAAVLKAVQLVRAGRRVGDLGHAMESVAVAEGMSVTRQYVGHGIGLSLHEEPQIPAWGRRGDGPKLREGMVICVEAQVIAGSDEVFTAPDGWSVKTQDGSKAVMFEYMVLVGKKGGEILTPTVDWPVICG